MTLTDQNEMTWEEREAGSNMKCAQTGCNDKAEYEHNGYYYCPSCWDRLGCSCGYRNDDCRC